MDRRYCSLWSLSEEDRMTAHAHSARVRLLIGVTFVFVLGVLYLGALASASAQAGS